MVLIEVELDANQHLRLERLDDAGGNPEKYRLGIVAPDGSYQVLDVMRPEALARLIEWGTEQLSPTEPPGAPEVQEVGMRVVVYQGSSKFEGVLQGRGV